MTAANTPAPAPRWEWRMFARSLPLAAETLAAARAGEPRVSEETYLLTARTEFNIKIRHGEIDIKHLEAVNDAGLERWRPVLSHPLPIPGTIVIEVCRSLGIAAPGKVGPSYDLEALLRDVIAPHPEVTSIHLVKQRSRLVVAGCEGEAVALQVGKQRWESLSFENADPKLVLAAVGRLGLQAQPNTSYPAGLRQILGLPSGILHPSHGAA